MNVLPVITRELRAQARQPFTYMLRLYGVAALLAVTCYVAFQPEFTAESGLKLFLWLHRALLVAIWLLIPLGAADCLSRERREGTLGLLFLTPLSAGDIIIAKCGAHAIRALTLWLASLPVLVLPFLLGGIGREMVLPCCVIHFCSIALTVSWSVLASAWCRQAQRAAALAAVGGMLLLAILAYFVTAVVALVFFITAALLPSAATGQVPWPDEEWWSDWVELIGSPLECVSGFLSLVLGTRYAWQQILSGAPKLVQDAALLSFSVGALVVLVLAIELMRLAARIIRRHWREAVRSRRAEQLEKQFCRPVLGVRFLKNWLRRSLEHNPIGWLERRSWSGRLVVWTWLAVMVAVYSLALTQLQFFMREFGTLQLTLSVLLLLSLTATAAGSFRRERETGVLELLLVSPLSERQIIAGRLRGLWMHFFPSVGLLVFVWFFTAGFLSRTNPWNALWVLSSFVTLPMIGLRNSISFPGYVSAFIATLVLDQVVPMLAVNLPQLWRALELLMGLRLTPNWPESEPTGMIFGIAVQLIIAIVLLVSLHENLVGRRFAMEGRRA